MTPARIVLVSLFLMALYWVSYFWSRTRLPKHVRYNHVFFLVNLLLIMFIVLVYQTWLINRLEIENALVVVSTGVMTAAALLHHISVLAYKKAFKHPFIERIHGPISHLLFFVPYGINSAIMGAALGALSVNVGDLLMVGLFILVSVGGSIVGVLVSVHKIALPYK